MFGMPRLEDGWSTKMKKSEMLSYLKFMEKYKSLVGLSDYRIFLIEKHEDNTNIAEVTIDIFEKFIKVNLYNKFKELSETERKETLMHELVHGRLNIAHQEEILTCQYIEENFVNDVTRGLMKYLKL